MNLHDSGETKGQGKDDYYHEGGSKEIFGSQLVEPLHVFEVYALDYQKVQNHNDRHQQEEGSKDKKLDVIVNQEVVVLDFCQLEKIVIQKGLRDLSQVDPLLGEEDVLEVGVLSSEDLKK